MPYKDPEARREAAREAQRRRRAKAKKEREAEDAAFEERAKGSAPVPLPEDPIGALTKWSHDTLIVPPGHPLSGQPMTLPDFGVDFLSDAMVSRESLLCIARKNAKSAIVAVYLLGRLLGPLKQLGYRAGVVSVTRDKAGELWAQVQDIARASDLLGHLSFRAATPMGIKSSYGAVDILSADKASGHASGFDDAIIDELGLLGEKDRALVNGMRSSISARNGRVISLTILGFGPFVPELVERQDDPSVSVHYYAAPPDCKLDDRDAWLAANPGLGTIKSMEYMEDTARRAAVSPNDEPDFRLFDLNQKVEPGAQRIVSLAQWQRVEVLDEELLPPRLGKCYVGVDFGGASSMTAAAAYWPDTGRLEGWGAFPATPDLFIRGEGDGVGKAYHLMSEAGELKVFDGVITPINPFLEWLAGELAERPHFVISDRYRKHDGLQARNDVDEVRDWPWDLTPVGMGPDGSEDVRAFQKAVIGRKVRVIKSLLWTQAISQSRIDYKKGNVALDKAQQRSRIDVLQAGILAVGSAWRAGAKGPGRTQSWFEAAREAGVSPVVTA